MNRRNDLLDRQTAVPGANFIAEFFEIVPCLSSLSAPFVFVRHEAGDGSPVAQDDDRLAALDLVEQLREMGLCDRSLHLGDIAALKGSGVFGKASAAGYHCEVNLIGRFDRSIYLDAADRQAFAPTAALQLSLCRMRAHDVVAEGEP
jgi:hypothetical protein